MSNFYQNHYIAPASVITDFVRLPVASTDVLIFKNYCSANGGRIVTVDYRYDSDGATTTTPTPITGEQPGYTEFALAGQDDWLTVQFSSNLACNRIGWWQVMQIEAGSGSSSPDMTCGTEANPCVFATSSELSTDMQAGAIIAAFFFVTLIFGIFYSIMTKKYEND